MNQNKLKSNENFTKLGKIGKVIKENFETSKLSKEKIIVALDFENLDSAMDVVKQLGSKVGAFKIGKQLFTIAGTEAIKYVHANGGKVFLDLKYHDIPNTVASAGIAAAELGVFMFNIHCRISDGNSYSFSRF